MTASLTTSPAEDGAERMSGIEWHHGSFGCHDLCDSDGTLLGYTMPCHAGVRGYVITRSGPGLAKFSGMIDHADEAKARAWVEERAIRALPAEQKGGGDAP